MTSNVHSEIEAIRSDLAAGRFANEAAVSQGVVLRILAALGWPIFDAQIVSPEYALEGRRVDFALCHPRNKPGIFVEVKRIGEAEGADRQLFEYAFHVGIPMAVLTDGQEWHFYLPGEQGSYEERRVYNLDLLQRDIDECVKRFTRYLEYRSWCEGKAFKAARDDYQNVSRTNIVQETLPAAWVKLIQEKDELLLELLADKVENLCGYKPDIDTVSAFLKNNELTSIKIPVKPTQKISADQPTVGHRPIVNAHGFGFRLNDNEHRANSAKDVLVKVFQELSRRDPTFLERFAARPKHGRSRRYLSRNKYELYRDRRDLCDSYSTELQPGWWIGTNYSRDNIAQIIEMACEVAGIKFNEELSICLGS